MLTGLGVATSFSNNLKVSELMGLLGSALLPDVDKIATDKWLGISHDISSVASFTGFFALKLLHSMHGSSDKKFMQINVIMLQI